MILELPVTSDPAQEFITQLGGAKYRMEIKYNDISSTWTADIYDPLTNTLMLAGVALTTGLNIMEPYNLELRTLAVVDTGLSGASAAPTPEDFGDRLKVVWWDNAS